MGSHFSSADDADFDGEIFSQWRMEQGHMVRRVTQPREDLILQANAEVRKDPGIIHDLGEQMGKGEQWGRWVLSIPELHWPRVLKRYPDLQSPDPELRMRELNKFMRSSDSDPYRMQPRNKARKHG